MADRPWPWGERGGDATRDGPTGIDAQTKRLIATERNAAVRAAWRARMAGLDPATRVFLDETSTHTSLVRTHGRSARGTRLVGAVPRNHGPNVSGLAALTPTGIAAPLVIEGAVDAAVFVP